MELRIFTEPQQGATYDDLLAVAQAAERFGYGAFFRSDHYLAMNTEGLPGPTDAWITLAGLARETSTIRLGTLVTSATFRHPGPLAISVAQVDQMSGGRVDLGIGAGWYEEEHQAYGIPFPPLKERFERLEESLAVITGLWRTPLGETFSYDGTHLTVKDSPGAPEAATAAGSARPDRRHRQEEDARPGREVRGRIQRPVPVRRRDAGRVRTGPARVQVHRSRPHRVGVFQRAVLCCGRTEEEIATRAMNIGREVSELRENGLAGSPAELVDKIGRYAEAGSQRIYLQTLDLSDLDHLELVASEVVPQLS